MGGFHLGSTPRARPDGEYPPGVVCYRKEPALQSPLLQVFLPGTFKHEGRRSKGVSFAPDEGQLQKGTTRTFEQAQNCCLSWSWSWWHSLTSDQRSGICAGVKNDAPAAKKQKR